MMLQQGHLVLLLATVVSCTPSDEQAHDFVQTRRWQVTAGGSSELLSLNSSGSSCDATQLFLKKYQAVPLAQMASTSDTPEIAGTINPESPLDDRLCATSWKSALALNQGLRAESRPAGPYVAEALPGKYFAIATRTGTCSVREDACGELGSERSEWLFFKLDDVTNAEAREELLHLDEAMERLERALRELVASRDGEVPDGSGRDGGGRDGGGRDGVAETSTRRARDGGN